MEEAGQNAYIGPCEALPDQSGLFAAVRTAPGVNILSIRQPLLQIVDSARLHDTCNQCFAWARARPSTSTDQELLSFDARATSLKTCVGCHLVKYCDKTCQARAWKRYHNLECKLFARLQPRILPTTVRAVVRLLMLREKGRLSEKDWVAISRLPSHHEDFETSDKDRWEGICLMSKGAAVYSRTTMGQAVTRQLYCKLLINSLSLVTATFDPIGICLDPLVASINHSCDPNAVVTFDGEHLSLMSLRNIRKDDELSISYIESTDPYHRRQQLLAARYFFRCTCSKCQHGPMLREDMFLDGAIDPTSMSAMEDATFDILEKAEKISEPNHAIQLLSEAMKALKDSASWPRDRQPWPGIRHLLAVSYLSAAQWIPALAHLLTIYFHIDPVLIPQTWHPLRVVHTWLLVMLVLQLADLSVSEPSAVKALDRYHLDYGTIVWCLAREVEQYVSKSHGSQSRFAIMVRRKVEKLRVDMAKSGSAMADIEGKHWLLERTKLQAVARLTEA